MVMKNILVMYGLIAVQSLNSKAELCYVLFCMEMVKIPSTL